MSGERRPLAEPDCAAEWATGRRVCTFMRAATCVWCKQIKWKKKKKVHAPGVEQEGCSGDGFASMLTAWHQVRSCGPSSSPVDWLDCDSIPWFIFYVMRSSEMLWLDGSSASGKHCHVYSRHFVWSTIKTRSHLLLLAGSWRKVKRMNVQNRMNLHDTCRWNESDLASLKEGSTNSFLSFASSCPLTKWELTWMNNKYIDLFLRQTMSTLLVSSSLSLLGDERWPWALTFAVRR